MATEDLKHIYDISLFSISDLDVLLHEILKYTRELLKAEAGTIYIKQQDFLKFHVFQNDALSYENIYRFYHSSNEYKLPLDVKDKYLAVDSFLTKKIIMIDDIYSASEYDFLGAKEFDKKFNYKTHSTISVPLVHPIDKNVLGVIQLLNKKDNDIYEVFTKKDKDVISMISSFISLSISKAQDDVLKLQELNNKLIKANEDLERKIEDKIKEDQNKSAIIFHQSKMASMGEMIGNIAHQWRQPLSTISTLASGVSINLEMESDNRQNSISQLKKIVKTTQELSRTIDDFRDFYNVNPMDENFNVSQAIKKSLEIAETELSINDIKIILNLDNSLYTYGLKSEFTQCVLNLLTNAKNALLLSIPKNEVRYIFIDLKEKNNIISLKIKDNAKGIDPSIKENIFEQKYINKENHKESGIGLFLTKLIIEKHMKGTISVENSTYSYKDKSYTGAVFTINLAE
jgi:two-component system, NtrC family, C4-dicarboxylate transport sensor histidine kinase DctB